MKLTRQGYNSFSLEGLTLDELNKLYLAMVYAKPRYFNKTIDNICRYLRNCNIVTVNPDDVNAIKTREE